MMMKILLACDKFKGSLSAQEVNAAVKQGFSKVFPTVEYQSCVVADGGEGFVHALVDAAGGELRTSVVEDALGREVEAEWGVIPQGNGKLAAVIEMSAASGLWRIVEEERDIMEASTFGTGQLIKIASEIPEVEHLYLGLGGSATNDGGTGMAQALGTQFFAGNRLITERMSPSQLASVTRLDLSAVVELPPITVACDVDSPLCGPLGASAVFGPQKGATTELIAILDQQLQSLSELMNRAEIAVFPGSGAAGGMGYGLIAFAQARLVSGFDLVADAIALEEQIQSADLIITGEGKMDEQSLAGKGPIGVAKLALEKGKPCLAIAGGMEESVDWASYFCAHAALSETGQSLSDLIANAEKYLVDTANLLAENVSKMQVFR